MKSSWPRLIGIASGIFGAALISAFAVRITTSNTVHVLRGSADFIPAICGCAFLFLSFPLFTGREWARRAFNFATYLTLVTLSIAFSLMIFQQTTSPPKVSHFASLLIGAGSLLSVLTPPAFIMAVLHHADIRRAFQDQQTSRCAKND